jgi:hypothetical protein
MRFITQKMGLGIAGIIGLMVLQEQWSVSRADVQGSVEQAKTETYRMTGYDDHGTATVCTVMLKSPGFKRMESSGEVIIDNWPARKQVALNLNNKVAIVANLVGEQWSTVGNTSRAIDPVKQLQQSEPLGEKEIDGKPAMEFRSMHDVKQPGFVMHAVTEMWVDKKEHQVVRMDDESETTTQVPSQSFWQVSKSQTKKSRIRLDNFQWNVPLDDRLFSVEIPEGYTVKDGGSLGIEIAK